MTETSPPVQLTSEDFAVPPIPNDGDRRKEKIHLAVGRAIHQWEFIEHHLGDLFATLLGTVVPVGAIRVYGSTMGFNVRQQMLMQAAEAFFYPHPNEDLEIEFKRVVKRVCDPASGRRNDIAHGIVIGEQRIAALPKYGVTVDGATMAELTRYHYFLVPSFHSSRKRDFASKPAYKYTSKEIETFTGKYRLLAGEVYRLGKSISDWRATWSKTTPAP